MVNIPRRLPPRGLWDAQSNLLAARPLDKGALVPGLRQPRADVAKRDRVGAHAKGRAPFLGNGPGQADDARLGRGIVCLAGIAVRARGARNVDNGPGLAVLDAKVGCRGADELEGRLGVQVHDGVPLLVGQLVDDAVVRVAGIVDDDVDLAAAKLGRLFDERRNVLAVEHVARHRERPATARVDAVGHGLRLGAVNVRDDDQRALVGKEARCFGADALPAAGDDGDLAGEHALRVVEVGSDLRDSGSHGFGFLFRLVPLCVCVCVLKYVYVYICVYMWDCEKGNGKRQQRKQGKRGILPAFYIYSRLLHEEV